MALTVKQQEKVQVCDANCIRRIGGVKRAHKSRMDELRVVIGVMERRKKTLVRSRLKWAGRVERMGNKKLAKRLPESGEKRSEDDGEYDGRTALREIWKTLEENVEQQQKITGDC